MFSPVTVLLLESITLLKNINGLPNLVSPLSSTHHHNILFVFTPELSCKLIKTLLSKGNCKLNAWPSYFSGAEYSKSPKAWANWLRNLRLVWVTGLE